MLQRLDCWLFLVDIKVSLTAILAKWAKFSSILYSKFQEVHIKENATLLLKDLIFFHFFVNAGFSSVAHVPYTFVRAFFCSCHANSCVFEMAEIIPNSSPLKATISTPPPATWPRLCLSCSAVETTAKETDNDSKLGCHASLCVWPL